MTRLAEVVSRLPVGLCQVLLNLAQFPTPSNKSIAYGYTQALRTHRFLRKEDYDFLLRLLIQLLEGRADNQHVASALRVRIEEDKKHEEPGPPT